MDVEKWIDDAINHAHLPEGLMKTVSSRFTKLKDDLKQDVDLDAPGVKEAFQKIFEAKNLLVLAAKNVKTQVGELVDDVTGDNSSTS